MSSILYVASDKEDPSRLCTGSVLCLGLVERLSSPSSIRVVNCDRREERPTWCRGTPTLQDESGAVHEGTEAYYALQETALSDARRQGNASAQKGSGAGGTFARTMAPARVQLRPERGTEGRRDESVERGEGQGEEEESPADGQEIIPLASDTNPWTSQVDDLQDDEEPTRKLTSDDLSKVMENRRKQTAPAQPPGGVQPPPLPPLEESSTRR